MVEARSAIRDVLASCLDDIERSGSARDQIAVEACLKKHPAYAAEMRPLLAAADMLWQAPLVKPPAAFRQQARSRLIAQIQPGAPEKAPLLKMVSQKLWPVRLQLRPSGADSRIRRLSLVWILLIVFAITVLLNGGTVYAADAAVPGERLYRLDRTLERLRAGITRDPEATVAMQLAFADERLSEAQELTGDVEGSHFKEALSGYGESMSTVAQTVGAAGDGTGEGLDRLLEQALSGHEALLASLVVPVEGDAPGGDAAAKRYCSSGEAHPVALSLAEQFEADAGQIMGWFCGRDGISGVGFGQIMLALRKQGQLGSGGPSTEEILERRANGEGWGQIWKDLGINGKPADAGPPEHAGPKDKATGAENAGPPDHAGPKEKN